MDVILALNKSRCFFTELPAKEVTDNLALTKLTALTKMF